MKHFIIIFIFSFTLAQIVPPELFKNINIEKIPENIPSIMTDQRNIVFNDYAISNQSSLGVFSYLKINSLINDNFQN